jgi:mono/diheme cytochrome c family protein
MTRSVILTSLVLGVVLPGVVSAQQAAPAGAAVYTQHCASCHEGSMARVPTR